MGFNVIFFTSAPSPDNFTRGYGAYRLATELRKIGFSVLTVDFSSALSEENFDKILDSAIDDTTLMVGFSTTWFPHYNKNSRQNSWTWGEKSGVTKPDAEWHPVSEDWYRNSLAFRISNGELSYFVKKIKNKNSKVKVVVGGAKSSEYVTEPDIDNVFIGYSENQLVDYIRAISKTGPLRIFNKIINYDIKATSGSFEFKTSFTEYVETDCIKPGERLTIEFSRGCIFNCTFCSFLHRNQNTKDFLKYKETLRHELMENWTKWGVYDYTITDDTFNDYTEKLILIKEVIDTLPFKPVFSFAFIRIDLVTPEQAQLIKDIGVTGVFIGLDAWGKEPAKAIRKSGNLEKIFRCFKTAKECWGDVVHNTTNIVVGLPNDTVEGIYESADWYIEEGHKYIDKLTYYSFILRSPEESDIYKSRSIIDAEPDKWGYSFPDEENPYYWERNNGNIKNSKQSHELMLEVMNKVKPYFRRRLDKYWNQFYDGSATAPQMYYRLTVEDYFPRLLNVLSKYKNSSN